MTRSTFISGLVFSAVFATLASPGLAQEKKPGKTAPAALPGTDRDPAPVAAAIDRKIDRRLVAAGVPASPAANDAEFLRRAFLDLAGTIPTPDRAAAFLDSPDPDKRRRLIDELLAAPEFGRHLADMWRPLLAPRDPANTKPQVDRFSPWLAGEFNRNRRWDSLAAELLGATGEVKDRPETTFVMAHAQNFQPMPDLLAAGAGRAFLGVQLQCAECHDHPFAPWKQGDFWGVAAFFGKLRNTGVKGPPYTLTEEPDPKPLAPKQGGVERPSIRPGGAIVIPATGGNKGAGGVMPPKLLGGEPLTFDDAAPFRPRFVAWATAKENPYFARAFANRVWAQLFGRGLVHPVDNLHDDNPASHPTVLDGLAAEFAAGGFHVKHLYRCVCATRAYQRSSRLLPGNEKDNTLFARMAVKPIGPEALYDSLAIVFSETKAGGKAVGSGKPAGGLNPAAKPGETKKPVTGKSYGPVNPREEFANFFRGQGGEPGEFIHGIPQFLRRMNGEAFNATPPVIDRLVREGTSPEAAIDRLYLATLSRRPTADERALMAKYVATRPSPEQGYAGVLWVLLNTGEFVLCR
jgi:hypothetical protein